MLNVAHVLPDHSAPGDGSLVAAERKLIVAIRTQALALKRQGISVDVAGKEIGATFEQQHPDWEDTNVSTFVKSVYDDPVDPVGMWTGNVLSSRLCKHCTLRAADL